MNTTRLQWNDLCGDGDAGRRSLHLFLIITVHCVSRSCHIPRIEASSGDTTLRRLLRTALAHLLGTAHLVVADDQLTDRRRRR